MKKLKLIFMMLAIVLLVPSCENDGGDSKHTLQEGAVPDIQKVATSDQSINLIAVNEGADINLSFTVELGVGEDVFQSLNVVLFYLKGDGTISKFVLDNDITAAEFPKTYSLTLADLYADFDNVDPGQIDISDKLIVSTEISLKDGTVIKMTNDDGTANYGTDISNSPLYSVIQTYVVSCPLDDASNFDGTYVVTVDEWADYVAGETVPVVYNPEDGLFSFRILSTNNPYIDNPDSSYMLVTIDPATSNVTVLSNEEFEYPGFANLLVTGTGKVGSCTGDIDVALAFGPYGPYNFSLVKE